MSLGRGLDGCVQLGPKTRRFGAHPWLQDSHGTPEPMDESPTGTPTSAIDRYMAARAAAVFEGVAAGPPTHGLRCALGFLGMGLA